MIISTIKIFFGAFLISISGHVSSLLQVLDHQPPRYIPPVSFKSPSQLWRISFKRFESRQGNSFTQPLHNVTCWKFINLRHVEKIIAFTLLIACKFRASNTFCIVVFLLVVGESVDKISSVSQIKKALILISSKCHFTYGFANIESFLQTLYQHLYLDTFE